MFRKIFLLLLLTLIAFIAYQWATFPDVDELRSSNPATTAFMERRQAQLRERGESDVIDHQWVAYERISPYLRRAVLVAEDDSFYDHEGVDVEGIKVAMRKNWESRKVGRGGSTITQQLAKNLYLSPTRSPLRKAREYLIARELERALTKKRILEIYLNVVEFGERVYGAEAAARHYFKKPASRLTSAQAALLAGCLPNPQVMNPDQPNRRLRKRQKMILSRMRRWGYLAEREVLTERKKKKSDVSKPAVAATPGVDSGETSTSSMGGVEPDAATSVTETALTGAVDGEAEALTESQSPEPATTVVPVEPPSSPTPPPSP